jgi:DNA (cytosine-5)-methyltransferase 1
MGTLIRAADLFCGAGGTSSGLYRACERNGIGLDLIAVNHWDIALQTHRANHPDARHIWASLDSLNPREVVKGQKLDLLIASPECIYHSNARGGKPIHEQDRASAWCVLRWVEALQPRAVLIENVGEFTNWGPLDERGHRIKDRAGETYTAYLNALRSLGYQVEARILNAADYGDPKNTGLQIKTFTTLPTHHSRCFGISAGWWDANPAQPWTMPLFGGGEGNG